MSAELVLTDLVAKGAIDRTRADTAKGFADRAGVPLGRWVLEEGWIARDVWAESSSRVLGIPFEMNPMTTGEVSRWPESFFEKHHCRGLRMENGVLLVGVSDPTDRENLEAVEGFVRVPTKAICVPEAVLRASGGGAPTRRPALALDEAQEDAHLRQLHELLQDAVRKRATDIHLEFEAGGTLRARFRIDGLLTATGWRASSTAGSIANRLKVLAEVDVTESRAPQDGSFSIRTGDIVIDARASFLPSNGGISIVIRLLNAEAGQETKLDLATLGFLAPERDALLNAARRPHGLALVTGPTGSGKTTTLFALLSEVEDASRKLVTIEDPIEYRLTSAVQLEVDEGAGVTFASGLRSILRHDPDRILVGEIRDRETAEIAIQAALTGHFVFTTLHASTSSGVAARMRSLGITPEALVPPVSIVIAQRLVRRACAGCATRGCPSCGGAGFRGRCVLAEVSRPAAGGSMQPVRSVREVAAELVSKKLTTAGEIVRVWPEAIE